MIPRSNKKTPVQTAKPIALPPSPLGQSISPFRSATQVLTPPSSPAHAPSTPSTMRTESPSFVYPLGSDQVQFSLIMPQARAVSLAGTFNGWDPCKTPMGKGADGTWHVTLKLPPGRHEYRFVADGVWISDPKAKEYVPNPFGGTNSVVTTRRLRPA